MQLTVLVISSQDKTLNSARIPGVGYDPPNPHSTLLRVITALSFHQLLTCFSLFFCL